MEVPRKQKLALRMSKPQKEPAHSGKSRQEQVSELQLIAVPKSCPPQRAQGPMPGIRCPPGSRKTNCAP